MLLSGLDNHEAGLGAMAESLAPNQQGRPGYEGYLRPDAISLAERLGAAGYRTLFSGKWHLGLAAEQDPTRVRAVHAHSVANAAGPAQTYGTKAGCAQVHTPGTGGSGVTG